jgi:endoribonuclease Dicer
MYVVYLTSCRLRFISSSYFKPAPRWDEKTRTLHLPKSCPLQNVVVEENINSKIMKQTACLKACKKLHEMGALTDNLVPDVVVEEGTAQEYGNVIVLQPFLPCCFDSLPLCSCNFFYNIVWRS